jgi:hypothetical protein
MLLAVFGCNSKSTLVENAVVDIVDENLPLPGFNIEGSDADAIMIADKVMEAMGGRSAWDQTKYISWNFFGRRTLLWNKHNGDVRIEFVDSNEIILVNINTMQGQVRKDGKTIDNPDSLASYLIKGKNIWINDSYWLVMPYKLKDSGVSLFYTGSDTTQMGEESYVLQLAFNNVGETPNNVYNVWVDVSSYLVTQWAYFENSEHTVPDIVTPWKGYKKYGNILLSGDRGKAQLTEIKILNDVPSTAFTSFEPINY